MSLQSYESEKKLIFSLHIILHIISKKKGIPNPPCILLTLTVPCLSSFALTKIYGHTQGIG